jgi:hypothetical protein
VTITRISDGRVLIDFTDPNIDMWRIGSSYIRSKFGLYRSLAGGRLDQDPVGQSPLLKNEALWITDFRVYEKNSNPTPGVPPLIIPVGRGRHSRRAPLPAPP